MTQIDTKVFNGSKTPGSAEPKPGVKNPASEKKLPLAFLDEGVQLLDVPSLVHGPKLGNNPARVLHLADVTGFFHCRKGGAKLLHLKLLLLQPLGPAQKHVRPAAGALAEIALSAGRSAGRAKVLEFQVIRLKPAFVAFKVHDFLLEK